MELYNITIEESFEDDLNWIKKIREYKEDIPVIIIGNWYDIKDYYYCKDEGEELAQEYNYDFYESSSKLGKILKSLLMIQLNKFLKKNLKKKLKK